MKTQNLEELQKRWHLQKATHTCAFCFCPRVSCPFAWDMSPKWIDREGLEKRNTETIGDNLATYKPTWPFFVGILEESNDLDSAWLDHS